MLQWKGFCKYRLSDSLQLLQTRQQAEGNALDLVIPCYAEVAVRAEVWLREPLLLLRYGDVDLREGWCSGLHHALLLLAGVVLRQTAVNGSCQSSVMEVPDLTVKLLNSPLYCNNLPFLQKVPLMEQLRLRSHGLRPQLFGRLVGVDLCAKSGRWLIGKSPPPRHQDH